MKPHTSENRFLALLWPIAMAVTVLGTCWWVLEAYRPTHHVGEGPGQHETLTP